MWLIGSIIIGSVELGLSLCPILSSATEVVWFAEVLALTRSSSDLSVAAILIFLNKSRETEKTQMVI